MAQISVQIVRNGNVVSFAPATQKVTPVDILFWANNDEQQAHQPAPVDSKGNVTNASAWLPTPISARQPGQPAPTSRGLTFDAPSVQAGQKLTSFSYSINYACALHPTEKGVITVEAQ